MIKDISLLAKLFHEKRDKETQQIDFDEFQMYKLMLYAHKIPKNHLTSDGNKW